MSRRKKWSTTSGPFTDDRRGHESMAAAYRYARNEAARWSAGALRPDARRLTVWVDERDGRGWRRFEVLDLAEYPEVIP